MNYPVCINFFSVFYFVCLIEIKKMQNYLSHPNFLILIFISKFKYFGKKVCVLRDCIENILKGYEFISFKMKRIYRMVIAHHKSMHKYHCWHHSSWSTASWTVNEVSEIKHVKRMNTSSGSGSPPHLIYITNFPSPKWRAWVTWGTFVHIFPSSWIELNSEMTTLACMQVQHIGFKSFFVHMQLFMRSQVIKF